jgi:hypothetical protein
MKKPKFTVSCRRHVIVADVAARLAVTSQAQRLMASFALLIAVCCQEGGTTR